ncbi:vomeronasal type-2 receptor 26-like [Erythrolamprus reginae]|uniref:vomeronasal type-2 receptor 26-like n=1 Tax=Erythrolamprus reginae TaxID=121349 RepID=UPI00396C7391
MLSTGQANVPNYSCGKKEYLLALLSAANRDVSIPMSAVATPYKVPQINDKIASEALSDKTQFPFFHPMFPKDGFQYPAIVQLLLRFRWTLIGLFASDTENGEHFMRTFTPMLVRNGICVVVSQQFTETGNIAPLREALSKWRQVNVFVHFLEYDSIWDRFLPFHLAFLRLPGPIRGKVWILTNFVLYNMRKSRLFKYIHSIWKFAFCGKGTPADDAFKPYFFVEKQFQKHYFQCNLSKFGISVRGRRRCTQIAPLDIQKKTNRIQLTNNHEIYSVFEALAHAMNDAYSSRLKRRRKEDEGRLGTPILQHWQFHPSLEKNPFLNISDRELYFDQNGELAADLAIISFLVIAKRKLQKGIVGTFERRSLIIYQDLLSQLKLLNKSLPQSKYTEKCTKCPNEKYPNEDRVKCIPKVTTFLSYEELLGIILVSFALLFFLITGFVLILFIKYRETALVKANNRDLSYILLVSLLLCFLSSSLFIGQPRKATCILRQMAFSLIFSIAISSLLAKTITVVLAFLATKPGNRAKRCVWVTFVPTYLSTKGKYMVAVQVFSIQASSAGLLGCIFIPKCYIILLRPHLNTKEYLTARRNMDT